MQLRVGGQKSRAADRKHFLVHKTPARVLGKFAAAQGNGQVNAFALQVQVNVGGDAAQLNVRVLLLEARNARHQPPSGRGRGHRQRDLVAGRHAAHLAQGLVHQRQAQTHLLQQVAPGFGQLHALVAPGKQHYAQLVLQQANGVAHRRLAHRKLQRRLGKTAGTRCHLKGNQVAHGGLVKAL